MPVTNLRGIKPKIWIPPAVTAIYKINIERLDGTVDDVTEIIAGCDITDGATESIVGDFEVSIWNPNGTFSDAYSGNEIFRFYMDYGTSATTLRFRGRVEKPKKVGLRIVMKGKGEIILYAERKVTESFDSTECGAILTSLIGIYAPGTRGTGIQTSTVSITVTWYEKPLIECILELCRAAGFDAYLAADLDWKFLPTGSKLNQSEGLVHDWNLAEPGFTFGPDLAQIRNRIKIFGADIDGIQVLYTANDKVGQEETYGTVANPFIKTDIIRDDNVSTYQQAVEQGEFLLSISKDPPDIGEGMSGTLLATIQPADSIRMSDPDNGLAPAAYLVTKFNHSIDIQGGGGLTTSVVINKEPSKLSHVLKSIIENANKSKGTQVNPHNMDFSYNFTYDIDSGTHSGTKITDSVLKLDDGQSSGKWTSAIRNETKNIKEAYLIVIGTKLTGATYRVTATNGSSFDAITNKSATLTTITVPGKGLKIEISITDTETEIDSVSLQYKRVE